jgi:two-component system, NarL family, nitrate/nitrite response regulator NarL
MDGKQSRKAHSRPGNSATFINRGGGCTEVRIMERGSSGTALIGPNALLREALAHILSGADFQILASAPCLDDSVAASLPQEHALLIIEASSDIDATVRQIETFKGHRPAGRVVVLAHQLELREMVLAFSAGANAYLLSVAASNIFIKSLELVMLGETILPPSLLGLLSNNEDASEGGNGTLDHNGQPEYDASNTDDRADDANDDDTDDDAEARRETLPKIDNNRVPRLSARQRLILRCLINGDSNKEIARRIHITEATVKVHVKAILRKIRVHNRTQAAIWAMNQRSFMPARDNQSSAVPRIEPFRRLMTRQVSPQGGEYPTSSSPEFEVGNSQDIERKND